MALLAIAVAAYAQQRWGVARFPESYLDIAETSNPSSPTAGYLRLWGEPTTHRLRCENILGTNCLTPTPTGAVYLMLTPCPAGYVEVPELLGRTLIGTSAAAGDVGTTGGNDTITPAGTIDPLTSTTVSGSAPTSVAAPQTPAFHGVPFDNRPAWTKVIFCRSN